MCDRLHYRCFCFGIIAQEFNLGALEDWNFFKHAKFNQCFSNSKPFNLLICVLHWELTFMPYSMETIYTTIYVLNFIAQVPTVLSYAKPWILGTRCLSLVFWYRGYFPIIFILEFGIRLGWIIDQVLSTLQRDMIPLESRLNHYETIATSVHCYE